MGVVIIWIVFSFIVGIIGAGRKIGFGGGFFLSLLLSPIIGLIIVLFSKTEDELKYEKEVLETQQKQVEAINDLKKETQKTSVADDLMKLKGLMDEGFLTKEEFEQEKAKILGK